MSALSVRLPDDKHDRLRNMAKYRGTTINRLIDEMATLMLAEFDAETRFRLRAGWRYSRRQLPDLQRGGPPRGMERVD